MPSTGFFFLFFLFPPLNLHNRAPAIFSFGRDLVWPSRSKFGWSSGENHLAAQPSYPRLLSVPQPGCVPPLDPQIGYRALARAAEYRDTVLTAAPAMRSSRKRDVGSQFPRKR